ncbi:hypothetical protein AB6A40_000003 [Gnathostoma spinigerum]|uniref:Uncharacterized protein n=1 Tax=Gnathostoma spinigerum TaxID=75299 RepID=A0ABD6E7D3_9BILA
MVLPVWANFWLATLYLIFDLFGFVSTAAVIYAITEHRYSTDLFHRLLAIICVSNCIQLGSYFVGDFTRIIGFNLLYSSLNLILGSLSFACRIFAVMMLYCLSICCYVYISPKILKQFLVYFCKFNVICCSVMGIMSFFIYISLGFQFGAPNQWVVDPKTEVALQFCKYDTILCVTICLFSCAIHLFAHILLSFTHHIRMTDSIREQMQLRIFNHTEIYVSFQTVLILVEPSGCLFVSPVWPEFGRFFFQCYHVLLPFIFMHSNRSIYDRMNRFWTILDIFKKSTAPFVCVDGTFDIAHSNGQNSSQYAKTNADNMDSLVLLRCENSIHVDLDDQLEVSL